MKRMPANSALTKRSVARGPKGSGGEPEFFSHEITHARRFYLDVAQRPGRLAVISGGREQCRPEYHIHREEFPYYSIEFVAGGEGTLMLAGKEHHLVAGDVYAYGPGVAHDIRSDPNKVLMKYFVNFEGTESRALLSGPGPDPGELVQTSAPEDLRRLFDELIAAGMRRTPFSTRITSLVMEHLLLRIAETAVSPGSIRTLAFLTYQGCREMIEEHFLELRGLRELAERCHVDRAYICRLFHRFDHESPYHYLMRLKMLEAAHRLQQPGMLVKQVAAQLGFADPFRFSRVFRRVLGVSPRRFAQVRGENVKRSRGV